MVLQESVLCLTLAVILCYILMILELYALQDRVGRKFLVSSKTVHEEMGWAKKEGKRRCIDRDSGIWLREIGQTM